MGATIALVFGRAVGVWDEVKEAQEFHPDCIVAVGRAGVDYPDRIDHWVSFHAAEFPIWIAARKKAKRQEVTSFWTTTHVGSGGPYKFENFKRVKCVGGSSGLIGALVALRFSERVILAGIPMDPTPTYDSNEPWREALKHRAAWEEQLPTLQGRVTSLSGWTRNLLGEPTLKWANKGG